MQSVLVSIIIPAYNIEKYLGRCLDGVVSQTYGNIEVIVVNDGSKDGTGKVIDEYAKKDSRIIPIHKENGGVSSARLAGIKASKGDYIGFVDGDDFIDPDMYERLVSNALMHNADISHCGYKIVFPKGHIDYYYNTGKNVVQDNITGIRDLLEGSFVEPGLSNKLYSRSLVLGFIESSVMDYSIKINEDLLMNYYLFKGAKCSVYEDFCPYHYILRAGSATTSKKEHHYSDPIKVRRIIYNDAKVKPQLLSASFSTYVRSLVAACNQKAFSNVKSSARAELKIELKNKNNVSCLSKNLRFLARFAAFSPLMYRTFRTVTDRLRGTYKKYSLDK